MYLCNYLHQPIRQSYQRAEGFFWWTISIKPHAEPPHLLTRLLFHYPDSWLSKHKYPTFHLIKPKYLLSKFAVKGCRKEQCWWTCKADKIMEGSDFTETYAQLGTGFMSVQLAALVVSNEDQNEGTGTGREETPTTSGIHSLLSHRIQRFGL